MTRRGGAPITGWDIGGVNTKAARVVAADATLAVAWLLSDELAGLPA
jgi:hypothetical protein